MSFHVIPFRLDILCIILIIQLVIGFNANFPDLPIDTHNKCKFDADTDVYNMEEDKESMMRTSSLSVMSRPRVELQWGISLHEKSLAASR